VPCELCGTPTRATSTKRCDGCWELETRIKRNPKLAARILAAHSESGRRWISVSEGLPADQPGGWLVFDTNAGKLWFETNLPSWWNRKDERGKEFDGPTVTHWREDFYPLPGPRK
jgi:hypothetical protein